MECLDTFFEEGGWGKFGHAGTKEPRWDSKDDAGRLDRPIVDLFSYSNKSEMRFSEKNKNTYEEKRQIEY